MKTREWATLQGDIAGLMQARAQEQSGGYLVCSLPKIGPHIEIHFGCVKGLAHVAQELENKFTHDGSPWTGRFPDWPYAERVQIDSLKFASGYGEWLHGGHLGQTK
jgi:hypothetical protein